MTLFGQAIPDSHHFFLTVGGLTAGTTTTIVTTVATHESHILFVMGIISYGMAILASYSHYKLTKKNRK
jgi:hypothetical protein